MFDHQALVLYDVDAGRAQARGALVVADAELEPRGERQRVEREDLVDVYGQVLWRAEQVTRSTGSRRSRRLATQRSPSTVSSFGETGTMRCPCCCM